MGCCPWGRTESDTTEVMHPPHGVLVLGLASECSGKLQKRGKPSLPRLPLVLLIQQRACHNGPHLPPARCPHQSPRLEGVDLGEVSSALQ